MNRKIKLLKAIRRKNKKNKGADEVSSNDFTGIQVKVEEVPAIEERQDKPEQPMPEDTEEARKERKNLAIMEMLSKNTYLEKVAFNEHRDGAESTKLVEEDILTCMCVTLGIAYGEDDTEDTSDNERRTRAYKIVKEKPTEKVGLSFVAFNHQDGIFVCKIKEGSKFNATGLKIGMRVVSINGKKCPERVGVLMKMLKKVEKELVLEVERVDSLKEKDETKVPKKGILKPWKKEVALSTKDAETREPKIENLKKEVEAQRSEVTTKAEAFDSTERRLYSSDSGIESGIESGIDDSNRERYAADSDSSQSSGSFWTLESPLTYHMDRFVAMIDGLVGADREGMEAKKGESFTLTEVAKKMHEGVPIWVFNE